MTKEQLEQDFIDLLEEKIKENDDSDMGRIEIQFLKDTLENIRAGHKLVPMSYSLK